MKGFKKVSKKRWLSFSVFLMLLIIAYYYGGNAPGLKGWSVRSELQTTQTVNVAKTSDVSAEQEMQNQDQTVTPVTQKVQAVPLPPSLTQKKELVTNTEDPVIESDSAPESAPESAPKPSNEKEIHLSADEKLLAAKSIAEKSGVKSVEKGDAGYSEKMGMTINASTGKDKYLTDPVPEGKPVPVEPESVTITEKELVCTLSISCKTINDNITWLDDEKKELVPADGWILPPTQVTFYEGESVFNVLLRTCKQYKIHMEFENTPMYNSAYIEGIHNLYEFDCGELSGWMYNVNGWFPNYGCSRYVLKDQDVIEWVYTCNLGIDVGGYAAIGGD